MVTTRSSRHKLQDIIAMGRKGTEAWNLAERWTLMRRNSMWNLNKFWQVVLQLKECKVANFQDHHSFPKIIITIPLKLLTTGPPHPPKMKIQLKGQNINTTSYKRTRKIYYITTKVNFECHEDPKKQINVNNTVPWVKVTSNLPWTWFSIS